MRIAIATREAGRNGELLAALRAAGFDAREAPLSRTTPPADPGELEAAVGSAAQNDWLVFQSPRGVRGFEEERRRLGAARAGSRIAAVGEETAGALRSAGYHVDLVPDAGSGALALASSFPEGTGAVLVIGAEGGRRELALALSVAGRPTRLVSAYRTVPLDPGGAVLSPLGAEPPPVVVLQAPSAVSALAAAAERHGFPLAARLVAVVPGATTEEAVRRLFPARIVVAESPDAEALAAAAVSAARLSP